MNVKYSICICNYNMADTIERALTSVLNQIDDKYEILVVDDGSTDTSVEIIRDLQTNYPSLRLLTLYRDKKRQLGETRNISVREALGDYVILHVDADDVWEPYIPAFVELFHRLEGCIGRDVLVSGQQINIGKKEFLLKHVPYRNIHLVEDRDMWYRLAAISAYIPVDHVVFRKRLARPTKINFYRILRNIWHQIVYDLRQRTRIFSYVIGCFTGVFRKNEKISFKTKVVRMVIIIPALIQSRISEPLSMPSSMPMHQDFVNYRERMRGTFPDLFARFGCSANISDLPQDTQAIFNREYL